MPTLDTYRKQAKLLMRWHRDGNYSLGGRVRGLERYRGLSDREVLAMAFPLALAQEVIAVEAGHADWAALKLAAQDAPKVPRAAAGPIRMKPAIPILFVRDVAAAAHFYADRLGFTTDFCHGDPPFYASVSRDGARLHLRHVGAPNFGELAAREDSLILATIEVGNVHALFGEYLAADIDMPQRMTKQPWGGTDFQVRDPDGNVISFVRYD